MDFATFLYRSKLITNGEYQRLIPRHLRMPSVPRDHLNDFAQQSLSNTSLDQLRPIPVGDALREFRSLPDILGRACVASFDQLIQLWWDWHLENLEPISEYSLASRFGDRLYQNQHEKQLVARYLAASGTALGVALVRDEDVVIIPEGSGGLYVGLALAAYKRGITIITSNGSLAREYYENVSFRKRLRAMRFVGGEIDADLRGTIGPDAQEQLVKFVGTGEPTATVVVSTVNGFLPDEGPYAPNAQAATNRYNLLDAALHANAREIIFVADYTKHYENKRKEYGLPIFNEGKWRDMIEAHVANVTIVTAPPPAICRYIQKDPSSRTILERDLRFADDIELSIPECRDYEITIKKLAEIWHAKIGECCVHEAFSNPARAFA